MSNISDDDGTFEQARFYYLNLPTAVMLMVFGVIGVMGNAVILMVYWKLVKMTTTQFLIFVIAAFDVFTALLAVPLIVVSKMYWFQIVNIYYCKFAIATVNFCVFSGSLLLFIVTFVRYCHVSRPRWLRWIEPEIKVMCVVSVMMGVFYSAVDAHFARLYTQNEKTGNQSLECYISSSKNGAIGNFLVQSKYLIGIANIIGVLILNILIIRKNRHVNKVVTRLTSLTKRMSAVSALKQVNDDRKKTNRPIFADVDESQNQNERDHLKSGNFQCEININDNNKEDEANCSKAENPSACNSIRSTKKADTTQCSDKCSFSFKESVLTTGINDDNDISTDFCNRPGVSIKKTRRPTARCSDNFKGFSRTTVMISLVSTVYFISYMPTCVTLLAGIDVFKTPLPISDSVRRFVLIPLDEMFYLSCAANPIIYTFVNPRFRSKCRLLFRS